MWQTIVNIHLDNQSICTNLKFQMSADSTIHELFVFEGSHFCKESLNLS